MTGSVYDTAWVSMVSKSAKGETAWLFPNSFQCICDVQGENGGWEGGEAIDEIVNTMACLLAMKRHHKTEISEEQEKIEGLTELEKKIDKARDFLVSKFADWNT